MNLNFSYPSGADHPIYTLNLDSSRHPVPLWVHETRSVVVRAPCWRFTSLTLCSISLLLDSPVTN